MSLRIFSAGLKHSAVRETWPAFEEVFYAFDPRNVRTMSDDDLEALMSEKRIIHRLGYILSVRANAIAVGDIAEEEGNMGVWLTK